MVRNSNIPCSRSILHESKWSTKKEPLTHGAFEATFDVQVDEDPVLPRGALLFADHSLEGRLVGGIRKILRALAGSFERGATPERCNTGVTRILFFLLEPALQGLGAPAGVWNL